MRSRWNIYHLVLVASFLVLSLILGSWIGSLNDIPVRNMLSTEGIRWMLKNVIENIESSPFIPVFILLVGLSVLNTSGFFRCFSFRKRYSSPFLGLSGKRLQAFLLATLFFVLYVGVVLFLTFSRYEILLSITGGLDRSPFLAALPFLIFAGCVILGSIYGLASGNYQGITDVIKGAVVLPSLLVGYSVYVIVISQLLAIWIYSDIGTCIGVNSSFITVVGWGLYYIPLILELIAVYDKMKIMG